MAKERVKEKAFIAGYGHRQRLRERFHKTGMQGFSDHEKVELLLTFAIPRKDCKPHAKRLLIRFETFSGVLDAPHAELITVEGIGRMAATMIKCVKALAEAYLQDGVQVKRRIMGPEDVVDYLRMALGGAREEAVYLLLLDTQNQLISIENVGQGTIDEAPIYIRNIVSLVLHKHAKHVILVHNHPSGDVRPSPSDKHVTRKLKEALALFDMALHDHIIVGAKSFYSFSAHHLL